MPLVTYLGKKDEMYANGYDFSDGPVDVPETNKKAIAKFEGNRYFFIDSENNHVAPKFYIYDIEMVRLPNTDTGVPQFKKIMGSIKGQGFQSEKEAKVWIKSNGGKLDKSHYIKKSTEGIADPPKVEKVKVAGVFKKKTNGELYKKPEKTFEGENCKEAAEDWIAENVDNQEGYEIMVK